MRPTSIPGKTDCQDQAVAYQVISKGCAIGISVVPGSIVRGHPQLFYWRKIIESNNFSSKLAIDEYERV